jgi:hypothetical protein
MPTCSSPKKYWVAHNHAIVNGRYHEYTLRGSQRQVSEGTVSKVAHSQAGSSSSPPIHQCYLEVAVVQPQTQHRTGLTGEVEALAQTTLHRANRERSQQATERSVWVDSDLRYMHELCGWVCNVGGDRQPSALHKFAFGCCLKLASPGWIRLVVFMHVFMHISRCMEPAHSDKIKY